MSARRRKAARAHTERVERYRGWQRKISERAVSPADAMAALLVGLFVFASKAAMVATAQPTLIPKISDSVKFFRGHLGRHDAIESCLRGCYLRQRRS